MKTYFISDGTYVKIGKSTDPAKRLAQLQTSHSVPLRILAIIDGDHEGACHRLFSNFRTRGEWFALTDEHLQLLSAFVSPPIEDRCIGIDNSKYRCHSRAVTSGFCDFCVVGPHLFLSDETCVFLSNAKWETIDEARRVIKDMKVAR